MAPAGYGDSVEGLHAVGAAANAGRVRSVVVERGRSERGDLPELLGRLEQSGVTIRFVDDVRSMATTTSPQGIVATCNPLLTVELEDLVAQSSPASLVVVDHVEDTHNLGAIVRSAVAAGISRVAIPSRRAAPLGAAAFKAAAGALELCSIAVINSVAHGIADLADLGVWTVGLDANGDRSLFGLEILPEPVALVIGGETGLTRLVRDRVDILASIPMSGQVESLNSSVAAALACFELRRSRNHV